MSPLNLSSCHPLLILPFVLFHQFIVKVIIYFLFLFFVVMMFPAVAILEKQFVEDKKYQFYYGVIALLVIL